MNKDLLVMPREPADFIDHARAQLDPGDPDSIDAVGRIAISHLHHHARAAHAALRQWGLDGLGAQIIALLDDVSALNIDADPAARWHVRLISRLRAFWTRLTDRAPTSAGLIRAGLPQVSDVHAATQRLTAALTPIKAELDEAVMALQAYADMLAASDTWSADTPADDVNAQLRAGELRLHLMQRAWVLRQNAAQARLLRERVSLCLQAAAVFAGSLEAVVVAARQTSAAPGLWQRLRGHAVTARDMALERALEGLRAQLERIGPFWSDDGWWDEPAAAAEPV